ncbi:MAG: cytochrome c oxidase assembly protein [Rhodocyclaceae bacterium]|nr:cytochrome c oxidase assembly protein [Rhodocyclaceae bacterium]
MSEIARENRRLLGRLIVGSLVMFGFGFLLVPFYEKICEVTGINRIVQPDRVANTQVDASRLITVEFDANSHDGAWDFRPLQGALRVHPGELATVVYEVANTRREPMTGQAVPSYGPPQAAQHFRKMECFCFAQQTLEAGERRTMPVAFVVDPDLPADVKTITLSYTFFEVEGRRARAPGVESGHGS